MAVGTQSQFQDRVDKRLGTINTTQLQPTADAKTQAMEDAIDLYSKLRPYRQVHEQSGSATTKRYVLNATITGWRDGQSRLVSAYDVSDANTDDETSDDIDDADWIMGIDTSGQDILILLETIPSTHTLRLVWEDVHAIDAATAADTTIPDHHTEVMTLFAVAALERWIARRASEMTDAGLGIDQVDLGSVANRYHELARKDLQTALDRLAPQGAQQSAAAWQEWDSESLLSDTLRISH